MQNPTQDFFKNQKQILDDLIATVRGVDYDQEVCPECGGNLVDTGDALVCAGCGFTAA